MDVLSPGDEVNYLYSVFQVDDDGDSPSMLPRDYDDRN